MKKQTICGIVAGLMVVAGNASAKFECTGTKGIVGTEKLSNSIWRYHQNITGERDGINFKKELTGLYIWDDCIRKLREYPYGSETKEEEFINDMKALREYTNWKKNK
jgi:hypothetical protein